MKMHQNKLLDGATAGAVGTVVVNALTYLDMAVTGRAASSTPRESVESVARISHIPVPGDGERRDNRISGIGSMLGYAVGTGTGALLGLAAGRLRWEPGLLSGTLVASAVAMVTANGPMIILGTTDPRAWSAADWLRDALPHLGYGFGAAWTFRRLRS